MLLFEQSKSLLVSMMIQMLRQEASSVVVVSDARNAHEMFDSWEAPLYNIESLVVIPSNWQVVGRLDRLLASEYLCYENGRRLNGEEYCLLRSLSLLKRYGRLAIFLSDNILTSQSKQELRELVIRSAHVDAVVSFSSMRGNIVILTRGFNAHWQTLMVHTSKVNQPEDISLVRAHCSGKDVYEERYNHRDVALVSNIGSLSWMPRAILFDAQLESSIGDCKRLSDYVRLVHNTRTLSFDFSTPFAENSDDGIRPSEKMLRASKRDPFLRKMDFIESGNLLLTRSLSRISANLVTRETSGLLLDTDSQTYEACYGVTDYLSVRLISLFFRSNKYRRYIAKRLSRTDWKEDVLNLLIPKVTEKIGSQLLREADHLDNQLQYIYSETSEMLNRISRIYRCENDNGPAIRLSEILTRAEDNSGFVCDKSILKNIDARNRFFNPVYLEGLLLSNHMPKEVLHYSRDIEALRYPDLLSRNFHLFVPPLEVQHRVALSVCDLVKRYKDLIQERRNLLNSNPVKDVIDNQLLYAYNPR